MDTNIDSKVQRIQTMLYVKASQEPETRFRRLYKYLTRQEWVEAAMEKVLRNRGSRTAGIDGKTRKHYTDEAACQTLAREILDQLKAGSYKPQAVKRVYIPKANGKKRPLGIPTIKDRVVQMMAKMLLEPIYEATFLPCSYGFRPNRCTWDALAEAYHYLQPFSQYYTVIEGDITNCFGTINHSVLMQQLKRRILDKQLLALIWSMLKAGVMEDLQYFETQEGTPQGGIVSPLLANVYMHRLDEYMHERFHKVSPVQRYYRRKQGEFISVKYIRYADDFIVLVRDGEKAAEFKKELADYISRELKMTLSEEKTCITHAKEGFDFLGVRTFIGPKRSNPQKTLPFQVPAEKSVKSYRQKVNTLTHPDLDYLPPGERIKTINWLIVGWANYHCWGNAKATFSEMSYWTIKKVHTMLRRYTPKGKKTTYLMYFRPVSECTNLKKWKKYTQWLTPSVEVPGNLRLGILPMSIISTGKYWRFRGSKIPPAFRLLDDPSLWNERETEFYTDLEAVENAEVGQASRWYEGKYSLTYFINRENVFRRDDYTCTVCGYKSQRQKGDVHDLETDHINPEGGYDANNLRTVCLACHRRLTNNKE